MPPSLIAPDARTIVLGGVEFRLPPSPAHAPDPLQGLLIATALELDALRNAVAGLALIVDRLSMGLALTETCEQTRLALENVAKQAAAIRAAHLSPKDEVSLGGGGTKKPPGVGPGGKAREVPSSQSRTTQCEEYTRAPPTSTPG